MSDACPPGSDLDRLLADQLRTEEEAALEAHVASCVACQRRLEELTAGERLHPTCLSTCDSGTAQTPLSHAGRYEIMDEIARGGIGVVYRAHDPTVNRKVAVKVLQERFRTNAAITSRFLEEGQITGQLDHPGIPAVHKIGTLPDGSPFLAMKLIKGVTLAARVAEPSPDRGRLIAVFLQVAQAVGYAHSKRVVHRDLKPANIMVGQFGEVQVMDWGLAKVLSNAVPPSAPEKSEAPPLHSLIETGRSSDPDTLTQVGSVLGTPAYMSPEQAGGETGLLDERADVFGLGAVLCEILTGQPPFWDTTLEGLRLRAVRGQLEDAFARLDGCGADPELIALCKRCLAPDRDSRPRNGGEVAAALSAHLAAVDERLQRAERERAAAEAKAAEEVNTRRIAEEKAAEQQKRRRAQRALLVCIGLLLFGAGTVAWWADRKAEERQADTLRRQIEDQQRAQEDAQRVAAEQQRLALNADAIRALLTQGEDALQHDDADRAGILLGQAEVRFAEGGADELRPQLARLTADLAMLRDLDRIDDLRWTVTEDGIPSVAQLAAETAAAFRRYGIVAGTTPPEAAARRVNDATIQDRLLTALDRWLRQARDKDNKTADALLEILHSADSDPYRDAVRAATRVNDTNRLKQLGDQREALDQPPQFATVLGQHSAIQRTRREQILLVAYQRRANNLTVLMELGHLYPINVKEGIAPRVAWYRAAVAARPTCSTAWNNLGVALSNKGDADGALAAYQEALHRNPSNFTAHYNLGTALQRRGDLDGAGAAYREALRLNPKSAFAHYGLGNFLKAKGDLDGAAAAYGEALRIDSKHAGFHYNLGDLLIMQGDPDGAVKEMREATRLEPKDILYQVGLGKALKASGDVDGAIRVFQEVIARQPKNAGHYTELGYALQAKGDLDGTLPVFRKAVELAPNDAGRQTALRRAEQRAERWGKLIPRITDIAAGRAEPESPADAMALAEVCRQPFQRRYVLAVRLAANAFEADATLADNLSAAHRYHSATAAVRAADGKDVELTKVEVEEWGYFTGIALKWLRADLALLRLQAKDPKKSSEVRKTLTTWKADPSLFVVRNRALLAAMPPADHKAWESLWTEVDVVLASIPSPEEPSPSRP